jgi:Lrp/AsnC family transcriptional regulator for asnA, asnC and gidA
MNQALENQIDSTDIRILEALMEDGRIAYSALADEIGSSNTLVHQRVKKLKDQGILRKPVFLVSPEHAGYDTTAFVLIIVRESNEIIDVLEALKKIPEVVSCISIMGRYDLMVRVYAVNNRHSAGYRP